MEIRSERKAVSKGCNGKTLELLVLKQQDISRSGMIQEGVRSQDRDAGFCRQADEGRELDPPKLARVCLISPLLPLEHAHAASRQ